jgi:cytoskeletal protein CcmA (bactofilin family)
MSLRLSLYDAATNCARDGATAVITLKSGVQFEGALEKQTTPDAETVHVKPRAGDGWATILVSEIAAVEARR